MDKEQRPEITEANREHELILKSGQIGYVDKYGIAHTFETPEQLSEFRSQENES